MKYKVNSNLKHGSESYVKGDIVELEEDVRELVESGVLTEIKEEVKEKKEATKETKEELDYSEKTVKELREIAGEKDIDIEGLKKAELIEALEE